MIFCQHPLPEFTGNWMVFWELENEIGGMINATNILAP